MTRVLCVDLLIFEIKEPDDDGFYMYRPFNLSVVLPLYIVYVDCCYFLKDRRVFVVIYGFVVATDFSTPPPSGIFLLAASDSSGLLK